MALIGKIRQKSWLVVVVILLALALFILSDRLFSPGNSQTKAIAGEINGTEIDYLKYSEKVDEEVRNARINRQGAALQDYEIRQIKEQVWSQFVMENTVLAQAKKLGLAVTKNELIDMVQGNNIMDNLKQAPQFKDANGQFNKDLIIDYLQKLAKADPNNQEANMAKYRWQMFEKSLPTFRLQEKYNDLFSKSNYITKAELEKNHQISNGKSVINYVYVPFSSVVDSTVKPSEADIKKYFEEHKYQYKSQQDQSVIDYVQFDYRPSKEDTAKVFNDMSNLVSKFEAATNDSVFVKLNSSAENGIQAVKPSEIPYGLLSKVPTPEPGKVYGPFLEMNNFKLYKVGSLKEDDKYSIRASHILIKVEGNTINDTVNAMAISNDILKRVKNGESFEMLAAQFGTDGTKQKGGDLGEFSEGQMVKEFNDAVFNKGSIGLLPQVVKTQFGYHVIKITSPKVKAKKQMIFTVEKPLNASPATRDRIVNLSSKFRESLKDASIDEVLKKPEFAGFFKSANVVVSKTSNGYVGGLPNAESIIKWAFDKKTENGDVSEYTINNSRVVAVFQRSTQKGESSFEDNREKALGELKNQLKGDIIVNKINQLKSNSLQELSNSYGAQAIYKMSDTLVLSGANLGGTYDLVSVGTAFGAKVGKKSGPVKGENGVLVVEKVAELPAQSLADYTVVKQGMIQSMTYSTMNGISQALNDLLGVVDNRMGN